MDGEAWGAYVGWDGECRVGIQEVLAGKLGAFVDEQLVEVSGPEEVLGSSEGVVGGHSPVVFGSLGVSVVGADNRFVDAVGADLGMPADTGVEHQVAEAYTHVEIPAGLEDEDEGQEWALDQAGTLEAVAGGTAA